MSANEYQKVLEFYGSYGELYKGYGGFIEKYDPHIAEAYLQKYWLGAAAYKKDWQALQASIFDMEKRLPAMIFKQAWGFVSLLGGTMLEKRDIVYLQHCMQVTGDRDFVVIQDTFGVEAKQLPYAFRMQYPATISWEELVSGNYISAAIFDLPENYYYLFGNSGKWGIYVASDEIQPVILIGFEKTYSQLFRTTFNIPPGEYCETMEDLDYIPADDRPNLKEWVPKPYRKVT